MFISIQPFTAICFFILGVLLLIVYAWVAKVYAWVLKVYSDQRKIRKDLDLLVKDSLIRPPTFGPTQRIIFPQHKITIKGLIMEVNAKVDQKFLHVFGDGQSDKYGNATTLNGDPKFFTGNADLLDFQKATQEEINAYNADIQAKLDAGAEGVTEADKISEAEYPYTGSGTTKEKVGSTTYGLTGDPSTADDDTPIQSLVLINIGAGSASTFNGTGRILGLKEDPDAN